MKKTFFVTAMACALVFVGCEKQSELNFNEIKGSAKVEGTVFYNEGDKLDDGVIISNNLVPASGQVVVVRVPYADYSAGATGDKTFEATVDAQGNYSIDIPVDLDGVNATIDIRPFKAAFYKMQNDAHKEITDALYDQVAPQLAALKIGDTKNHKFEVKTLAELDKNDRTQRVTLFGKYAIQAELRDGNNLTRDKRPLGANVSVTLKSTLGVDNREIKYFATVNNEGNYQVEATFYDEWKFDEVSVTVKSVAFPGDFTHHCRFKTTGEWETQGLYGIYQSAQKTVNVSNDNKLLWLSVPEMISVFTPENISVIKGIGNGIDWGVGGQIYFTNNPLGW